MHLLAALLLWGLPQGVEATDVEGLWGYETIRSGGGREVAIDGLFLLRDGRFVQQSLNRGEPYDRQVAQAHSGTYRVVEGRLHLEADVGLLVNPKGDAAVEDRSDTRHEVTLSRSGSTLLFTFGTGTIQVLQRLGAGGGEILILDRGALALADDSFLLVHTGAEGTTAGSGRFERRGADLTLRAERWLSVESGRATYGRDLEIHAVLGRDGVTIAGGATLPFARSNDR